MDLPRPHSIGEVGCAGVIARELHRIGELSIQCVCVCVCVCVCPRMYMCVCENVYVGVVPD